MDYEVCLHLGVSPDLAAAVYADTSGWPAWQLGLVHVREVGRQRRELDFAYPGFQRVITEQLVSAEPTGYVAIYTTADSWNLCENRFQPDGDGTSWVQHNEWRFDEVEASEDDRERFQATTLATMRAFRSYVERRDETA